jgi:exosortase/archaeosortase family protein
MTIPEKWKQIPRPVKLFLLRAIALFVVWKALYLLFLLPSRTLDRPLTNVITIGAVGALNGIGQLKGAAHAHDYTAVSAQHPKTDADGQFNRWEDTMDIYSYGVRDLSVADACNGLELMVLYAGLILCLPSRPKRKALFIGAGVLVIGILNILRCAGLVLLFLHRPDYVDFSHHYLFSLLVYGAIFWLWWLFSRDPGFAKNMKGHAALG